MRLARPGCRGLSRRGVRDHEAYLAPFVPSLVILARGEPGKHGDRDRLTSLRSRGAYRLRDCRIAQGALLA